MRLHSNHRKIGRTLPLTAGVTSGLMGNVVLGNLKWGMSHHLSPSLSHYASAAHACFVCVSVWLGFFFPPYWCLTVWITFGMTAELWVDLATHWESLGCRSVLCVQVISGVSVHLGSAVRAGSCWHTRREDMLLQYRHKHTHTHTHTCTRAHTHTHLKAETVLLCLYLAPCLGIPGSAHRVYWHSCLIACSIVHSVRANPPISLSLSLRHTHTHTHTHTHSQSIRLIIPSHTQLWSTARWGIHQNRHSQPVVTVHWTMFER